MGRGFWEVKQGFAPCLLAYSETSSFRSSLKSFGGETVDVAAIVYFCGEIALDDISLIVICNAVEKKRVN